MQSFTPKRLELIQALLEKQDLRTVTDEAIPRRHGEGPAALSLAQERLWFLCRMAPASPVFNIAAVHHLDGRIDVQLLDQALALVLARHDALRTVFPAVDGSPVQLVLPGLRAPLALVDLRGAPASEREGEALRRANAEARRTFDLDHGPLLRLVAYRLEEERHLLLLVIHHLVAEVQSLGVFVRDLARAYSALQSAETPGLAPLALQFADFAQWQRERMQGERLATGLAFWKDALRGSSPVLELATDRPRAPVQSFAGGTRTRPLPAALSARVRAFSQELGVTPFAVFAAAWGALLAREAGQPDVLLGVPFTDRDRAAVQDLIGFFVNTIVLRVQVDEARGFRDLTRRVNESSLGARAHQELPFEVLVDALGGARDLSRSPLFQVAILYQSATEAELARSSYPGAFAVRPHEDPLAVHTGTSKFDATLVVFDRGTAFNLSCEYSTDLFDPATIDRLLAHLEQLLLSALAEPERAIAELGLLTSEERELIGAWSSGARTAPEEVCADELVEAQARRTPDAAALVDGDVVLTYRELDERANRLAHHLRALGVGTEDVVAIATGRSPEMVVGILGALKAGAAYLPLDLGYPPQRLAAMLADAPARIVLTRAALRASLPAHAGTTIALDADGGALARQAATPPERRTNAGNLAYVIYTSGSTGVPKGVALEHRGLVNLVAWHRRSYRVGPGDRATHLAGLAFDASVWELWPYLASGACLVLVPDEVRLVPAKLAEFFAAQRITHTFLPTPLAEAFLREPVPQDLALRFLLTGGDKLHRAPEHELPFQLVNHYGPTENTVVATCCIVEPRPGDERAPPIGRPIDNVEIRVLDAARQPVGIGIPGELYIGGRSLARGYHRRPELTVERFVPDPLRAGARLYTTGDVVRWLPGGELEFLGRRDGQVKVRGYRIELGEVEARLASHPDVAACAVTVRPDAAGLATLVAYPVPVAGRTPSIEGLRAFLGETLPEYMVPASFVLLEALPLNPSGKVDLRALPAPEPAGLGDHAFEAPVGELEEAIAGAWKRALQIEHVGVTGNFFALGGHSLLLVRVHAELQKTLHPGLSIVDLFRHPTVRSLAAHIEAARAGKDEGKGVERGRERGALRRASIEARTKED